MFSCRLNGAFRAISVRNYARGPKAHPLNRTPAKKVSLDEWDDMFEKGLPRARRFETRKFDKKLKHISPPAEYMRTTLFNQNIKRLDKTAYVDPAADPHLHRDNSNKKQDSYDNVYGSFLDQEENRPHSPVERKYEPDTESTTITMVPKTTPVDPVPDELPPNHYFQSISERHRSKKTFESRHSLSDGTYEKSFFEEAAERDREMQRNGDGNKATDVEDYEPEDPIGEPYKDMMGMYEQDYKERAAISGKVKPVAELPIGSSYKDMLQDPNNPSTHLPSADTPEPRCLDEPIEEEENIYANLYSNYIDDPEDNTNIGGSFHASENSGVVNKHEDMSKYSADLDRSSNNSYLRAKENRIQAQRDTYKKHFGSTSLDTELAVSENTQPVSSPEKKVTLKYIDSLPARMAGAPTVKKDQTERITEKAYFEKTRLHKTKSVTEEINVKNLMANVKNLNGEQKIKKFRRDMTKASTTKRRANTGLFLVVGKELLVNAVRSGIQLRSLYCDEGDLDDVTDVVAELRSYFNQHQPYELPSIVALPKHEIVKYDLKSSTIIGLCGKPTYKESCTRRLPVTLILDNIRDPSNMGTILRSAASVSATKVLATKGCVDLWDEKVVTEGSGAHFYVPMYNNISWQDITNYIHTTDKIYLADNKPDSVKTNISTELLKKIKKSKKAAASPESVSWIQGMVSEKPMSDMSYQDTEHVALFDKFPLPSKVAFEADLQTHNSVIVIGGESLGLSAEAHKLAYEKRGHKLYIPMGKEVDSLNASMAGLCTMYEVLKQTVSKMRNKTEKTAEEYYKDIGLSFNKKDSDRLIVTQESITEESPLYEVDPRDELKELLLKKTPESMEGMEKEAHVMS